MYSTVTKVRQVAGFVGNSNVTDAFISSMLTRAEGLINSYIGSIYVLPLQKQYFRTIVFSGTGTGSATMTITIDGTGYTVAITNSLTASAAADLFRTGASSSTSFVVDAVGSGATVTIYTYTGNDSTQLTITSSDPQTVSGITATSGTVTEIAVPLVETLATEIAAAMLLTAEYGAEAQGTDKDGNRRMEFWMEMLEAIKKKIEKLFDFAGVILPLSTTDSIAFYPTETSYDDTDNPTGNFFERNQKF